MRGRQEPGRNARQCQTRGTAGGVAQLLPVRRTGGVRARPFGRTGGRGTVRPVWLSEDDDDVGGGSSASSSSA